MSTADDLQSVDVESLVAAALVIARPQLRDGRLFDLSMQAALVSAVEQPDALGLPFVFDWVVLLSGEPLVAPSAQLPQHLAKTLRRYEDAVLARLQLDGRFLRIKEALAGLPSSARPIGFGLVASQVQCRLAFTMPTAINVAPVLRRLLRKPLGDITELGLRRLEDDNVSAWLERSMASMVTAVSAQSSLLSDADLSWAENTEALQSLAVRTALAQVADAAERIEASVPRRMRAIAQDDLGRATALEQESAFPVGGFSSIATRGSLENLVASELMYMERGEALRPDLFDIRFAGGELLYYSRDESVAIRRRRGLAFVFDQSLKSARVLDSNEHTQRLVWALAAVVVCVKTLVSWLDRETLTIELVFKGDSAETPLQEEMTVASLMLRSFILKRQVKVGQQGQEETVIQLRQRLGPRAHVVQLISATPSAPLEGVDVVVQLAQSLVTMSTERPHRFEAFEGQAQNGFTRLSLALLSALL
jgi:hypothetical protein